MAAAAPVVPSVEIPPINVDMHNMNSPTAVEDVDILVPWDDDEVHRQEPVMLFRSLAFCGVLDAHVFAM